MFHVKPLKIMENTMKRTIALSTLSLFFVLLLSAVFPTPAILAQTPQPTVPPERQKAAQDFINLMNQGQFDQAMQTFDPTLVKANMNTQLQEAWNGLIKQLGAFQKISETTPIHEMGFDTIYATTDFAQGSVDIKVIFNASGQIVGMFFTPAGTGKAAAQPYQTAPYTKPDSFTEQAVTVGSGDWPLPGILSMPKGPGPFPAVVLVHGSGPNDRDETIFNNKPFRDLAEGLASQGIAVLRYDKRSKVYGEQMQGLSEGKTVQEGVIDDALAALDLLRGTPEIDPQRIYLLGHSLGAMLAPRIATQANDLAGAIIMAGPTRPLEDIIVDQMTYLTQLAGTATPEQQAAIDQIKQQAAKVKDANLTPDVSRAELLGFPATFWLDLRGYQPDKTAATLPIPLFILRGERDYQVAQTDFEGWQATLGNKAGVFLKQYPGLNHLFMSGSGPSTPQEYQRASHVSELVVKDIASFIKSGEVNTNTPLIGGRLSFQEITRLVLLILPILLIQFGISIYALVDLARRKKTHGPRWLWAVLLVITLFALPTGLIVAAVYLLWGRKEEEDEDGDDDSN
jgi:dienelactone hydrolase